MRTTEVRNQTSRGVACNHEAVLPINSENPVLQGEILDYEDPRRSATKRAVGRSKIQQQEQSGDPPSISDPETRSDTPGYVRWDKTSQLARKQLKTNC